jgi:hypothetical protein
MAASGRGGSQSRPHPSHDGPAEDPLGVDSSDPSVFFESLLAPMPVPRVIWWRNGIGPRDETRAQRGPRR